MRQQRIRPEDQACARVVIGVAAVVAVLYFLVRPAVEWLGGQDLPAWFRVVWFLAVIGGALALAGWNMGGWQKPPTLPPDGEDHDG